MNKQKIKKELKFIGRKAFGAFIFVAVAGTSIWALAAFTEPTDTPGNSVQDFAKNIMGANNSDNAFDSGDVVANSDGSIVERLEKLEQGNDSSYATCVTVFNYTTSGAYYQDCPSGFVSVQQGQAWQFYDSATWTNYYQNYNACCLPR